MENSPSEKPFDFTDLIERQKEEFDTDLDLCFQVAEQDKLIYNQTPRKTIIEDIEKIRDEFFTFGVFFLVEEGDDFLEIVVN